MLQRLTDKVIQYNRESNVLQAQKENIENQLKILGENMERLENKIESMLPDGLTLLQHFQEAEERRKDDRPSKERTEAAPEGQTPDEPSSGAPLSDGP